MKEINFNGENLVLQEANTRDVHNETREDPGKIVNAFHIFVKSGSANGNEEMRRKCLKIVNSKRFLKFIRDNQ